MNRIRIGLAIVALAIMFTVGLVAQVANPSGKKMSDAARRFLDSLTAEQRARATFPIDSAERMQWFFVPRQDAEKKPTRKGLRFEEMTAAQHEAALALLQSGTSVRGYQQATTIISLESILAVLEKGGRLVRNPGWYFVTIFGSPGNVGKWGWRIEGHHLSINYLIDDGKVVAATPAFFGANPATVMSGEQKGLRAIPDVDDLARELFQSFDNEQKQLALQLSSTLPRKQFPEIVNNDGARHGAVAGVAAAKMSEKQRELLTKLIRAYIGRLPDDVAQSEWDRIERAGIDKVHFAYAGGVEPGQQRSYRLQGPSFIAEFLNEQDDSARNPANHIHSVWRHLPKDFGL